jgi:hypothetical protein
VSSHVAFPDRRKRAAPRSWNASGRRHERGQRDRVLLDDGDRA